MDRIYDSLFERVPGALLRTISNGCRMGDMAYEQITKSEPRLFYSKYIGGLRSRLHDKAIQLYLEERLKTEKMVQVFSKHTGFGNYVASISGKDFGIIPCHVSEMGGLPAPARYKYKACESNPDEDVAQTSLFTPPVADDYSYIQFFATTYFDGMNTIATLVLPNRSLSSILYQRPIMSFVMTDEEVQYQERKVPKLIAEVAEENEQKQGAI